VCIQPISWSTVHSDCPQLTILSACLQTSVLSVFKSQYQSSLQQAYIAACHFPRKFGLLISNVEAERLAKALTDTMGMEEVEITAAEVVIVEDCRVEVSVAVQIWPLSGLVRAYFNTSLPVK